MKRKTGINPPSDSYLKAMAWLRENADRRMELRGSDGGVVCRLIDEDGDTWAEAVGFDAEIAIGEVGLGIVDGEQP